MHIGTTLRERRLELGIRQVDLAARVRISKGYLCHFESGRRVVDGSIIARIEAVLAAEAAARGGSTAHPYKRPSPVRPAPHRAAFRANGNHAEPSLRGYGAVAPIVWIGPYVVVHMTTRTADGELIRFAWIDVRVPAPGGLDAARYEDTEGAMEALRCRILRVKQCSSLQI
jgi:transcriptional regulator with XRE-family HTH domain